MKAISNNKFVSIVVLLLLALPLIVAAETVVRTGNSVSIATTQTVENDLYAAAGSVSHSGEVKEDMYVAAGSITINGEIGTDLTALGGSVQVHSPVGDDVRVVAGETVIASDVGGDVFVMSGSLKVLSSATVKGNVYFYGGEAVIDGKVTGIVMGRAESFTINSEVGGMDVYAVGVELTDRASVRGDLTYSAVSELSRAPGAVVEGEIVRGAAKDTEAEGGSAFPVVFVFIWLFTTLCIFLLFRRHLENLISVARRDTLRVGIIGLVAAITGPIIGIVLIATVLGVWLGIIKLLVTALLLIVTLLVMPIVVGAVSISYWKPHRRLDALTILAGMAIIMVVSLIPVLGGLLIFIVYAVTLGSILYLLYQKGRSLI